jgi:hypothetical protein
MIENEVVEFRGVREDEPKSTAELIHRRPDRVDAGTDSHVALFPQNESEDLRSRWRDIQGRFVDEPRHAVEEADQLVASAINRLAEVFAGEKETLESQWSKGQDVSTEDLRQTLRRYRSFFDRLLSM